MFRSKTAEVTIEQRDLALVGQRLHSICSFEVTKVNPGQVTLRFTNLSQKVAKVWLFHRQGSSQSMTREQEVVTAGTLEFVEVIEESRVSTFIFEWQLEDDDGDNRTATIVCKPK